MSTPVLVFDMDGVLVDVTGSYREAIRRTVQYFTGKLIDNEMIQALKNQGGWTNDWAVAHKIIQDLGVSVDYPSVVAKFQELFLGANGEGLVLLEQWIPKPGLLERLRHRYRFAIFTGRPREEALLTVRRFAWHLKFDPVVASEDVEHGKPSPEGLFLIKRLTGATELWYVGDTVDDAASASAAGVPFIGIASPSVPRREELVRKFNELGAVAILGSVNELETVL